MKKCPVCGRVLHPYEEHHLDEKGECFECSLWRERLPLVGKPNVAIIDGTLYTIGPEDDTPKSCRGFGGDKFEIHFKDGRKVTTTNLWCGGSISEHWKPMFPNNADFDWEWKETGCGTQFLAPKKK